MAQHTGDFWSEQQHRGNERQQNQLASHHQPLRQPMHQPIRQPLHQPLQHPPSQRAHHHYPGPFEQDNARIPQPLNYGAPATHATADNARHQTPFAHYQPQFIDQGRITVVPVNQSQHDLPQRSYNNYQQNIRYPGSRFPLTNLPEVGATVQQTVISTGNEVGGRGDGQSRMDHQMQRRSDSRSDGSVACKACSGTGRRPLSANGEDFGSTCTKTKPSLREQRITAVKAVTGFLVVAAVMVAASFGAYYMWKWIGV